MCAAAGSTAICHPPLQAKGRRAMQKIVTMNKHVCVCVCACALLQAALLAAAPPLQAKGSSWSPPALLELSQAVSAKVKPHDSLMTADMST